MATEARSPSQAAEDGYSSYIGFASPDPDLTEDPAFFGWRPPQEDYFINLLNMSLRCEPVRAQAGEDCTQKCYMCAALP